MKYRISLAALLATTAFVAAPALAQSTIEDPAAAEEHGGDIIVTAQKIEQRATDVPITISAITGERMAEIGVSDLDELSNYIPGLNIQEQSANNPGIVIRGITSDSGSAQQGPRVTLYYNGVDISRSRGSYQAIYDLERVEVIKGPQATLFGTASAVGAISLTSARPKPGYSGALTAAYGNYDSTLLSGFLNAGSDTLAGRVAFEWKKRDGYVENLSPRQEKELYSQDQLGVRASLRYTPADALTVDLIGTYDQQRNGGTPFISRVLPTEAGPGDPFGKANLGGSPLSEQALGDDQLGLNREVYDVNLTANYDFGSGVTFTTVNGYRKFDSREVFDADGSAAWFLEFAEISKGWQASHEGRFSYSDPQWRASFGWNVFVEDNFQNVPFSSEEGSFIQCLTALQGRPALPGAPAVPCVGFTPGVPTAANATALATGGRLTQIPYRSVYENQGRNDSYSMFADTTWIPTPALELTAGVRILIEQRKSGYRADVPVPLLPTLLPAEQRALLLAAGIGPSLLPGQIDTRGQTFTARRSYSAVLPRFNMLYRLTDDVNVFATISKGRRSPVVQLNARRLATGAPASNLQLVPEESVWNYEAGLKGSVGPVSGSLGVYYQKYDGFQVSVLQPNGTSLTQSAGTASNLGAEAELNVRATSWLNLFGNVGYINGGIDENESFASTFSGARFRLQPEWQAAAGFTINAPLGNGVRFFATPTVTHRSRIFFEVPNNIALSQGPVTLVNARAGVSFMDERFELAGFIRNATDERYLLDAGNTGGSFRTPTFIPAEPRFYGAQLTARF
ncbi:TonB-dependent receptor [Sphingomonas xinjiangensis]|uniref:Outer membrane receptor protein involved in Fe transport n=1 Tax=Sphingomonas xinjiangensis TaxID=643568 RepID=A0A840YKW7_9SPHN|nr:TonB-dependent receptor [Sphingomonas xinjiangensis]MBB5709926.1 outer membrane receptor protein involved in Fe transport [Sphingomonas xinjiangensis]